MGLLDSLFPNGGGTGSTGGLLDFLQQPGWQYPTSAPDAAAAKKKQDADFLAGINQNPYDGVSNPNATPIMQGGGNWPANAAPLIGTGGAATPFGLGGINLPQQSPSQGAPASGAFPAVPFAPPAPQAAAVPPPQAAAPAASPTLAPQNNPINTMNIGGYQMPQFGSAADYTPTTTPANAQPTQGQLPQQSPEELPRALGGQPTGFFDRLNTGLQSMGHGGSLIGALTGNRTDPTSIGQQNLKAQYDAVRSTLLESGATPQQAASKAMLAVMNPEAGKTILAEALTNKEKWGEIGSDSFGNKTMGFINERDQTINGKAAGAEGGAGNASTGFLAPGVKGIDSTLNGKDYLEQFSPEVQAAVQNYIDGKSTPTGNPRKGFTQTVKMIAQKVGADTGQSVDDTTYAARRTMRNQLSSSAPSSLGGQINIGNTAAGHLADLTQKALDLGNYDTGIAPLTSLVNNARGLGTEQAAKMEALKGAAQHYGQEITKFYAGSPGGVAERDRFIESVNGARSPKELAAILATEGELMRSRLDALGGQIKGVLGEEGSKQYPVLRPDGQTALAKVEENVARLKGGAGNPAAAAKPATVTQNGHVYNLQADGSYK